MHIRNRRANYDYLIEDSLEAGLILKGSEVKALRQGKASINESFAAIKDSELWLMNSYIGPYSSTANYFSHETRRERKMLLNRRQINKFIGKLKKSGFSLVPMSLYFNQKGIAKIKVGLGKGKSNIDKRRTIKDREWEKRKQKLLRE